MADGISRVRRLGFAIGALCVLAAIGVGVYFTTRKPSIPQPVERNPELTIPAEEYRKVVADFETGTAALDVGFDPEAKSPLQRAARLAPGEPAIWADLALFYLRSSDLTHAAEMLDNAQRLAPDNSYVTTLRAGLDRTIGKNSESLDLLRKAVEQSPENARARFAVYTDLEERDDPDVLPEAQRQLEAILRFRPENPYVRALLAVLAVRQGNRALARRSLAPLRRQARAWSNPVAASQYAQVERALTNGDDKTVIEETLKLKNVLASMPAGLTTMAGQLGLDASAIPPLSSFLRLRSPAPTAAPADTSLTFQERPVSAAADPSRKWDQILVVPLRAWGSAATSAAAPVFSPALALADTVRQAPDVIEALIPAVVVADGHEVRRLDRPGLVFPFPGGSTGMAPSPDGVLPIDWNNDFRIDFFLAGAGGIRFMEQDAQGQFVDITARTKLPDSVIHGDYYGAWAIDIDLDGDLDIALAPRQGEPAVLRNNRNGTWTVIKPFVGVREVRALVWADIDHDGIPDVAMLDASGKLHAFINDRAGQFHRWPVEVDSAGYRLLALTAADLGNRGTFDLLAVRADGAVVALDWQQAANKWRATQVVSWQGASAQVQVGDVRLLVGDLDNNGSLDLVLSQPSKSSVWLSASAGKFPASPITVPARTCALASLSPAGALELVGTSVRRLPVHYVPRGTKNYRWLVVRPKALTLADGRINPFGIGGEMQVRAGLLVEKQLITGPRVYFGLGEHPVANVIRIVWPNGTTQAEFSKNADETVYALQRLKGSCPWLFAFDGKHMCFVTDVLWRSPLGLRINAQETAGIVQTQDWVRIRGDQLRPHDGYYDLRITAELWETHFFDMVKLMAVDHPVGTEIFVDERFAVPPTALKVHLTTPPRPVRRAVDDNGQDVTDTLRVLDGRYLDTFGRGPFQGLTRDHWLELELDDDPPGNGPLWLIAQGWIHPTDSSINVAIAQAQAGPPQGLSLEIPDGKGGWKTARNNLGFPAGKTKTILINLDGLFAPGVPHRVRLRTNMEIYWDRIASARGLDEGQLRTRQLVPEKADLRFRGYSTVHQANPSSPELPHYDQLNGTRERWRDLIGYYTRFGDVRELLQKVDDRYVIMNAGDELALRFPALPPPPTGWVRDYVFISDGWEKDGDYNTGFSGTVLPLPSHGNAAYNTPPGRLEDDPVYRRHPSDWTRYHTRYVTPDVFSRGLMPGGKW